MRRQIILPIILISLGFLLFTLAFLFFSVAKLKGADELVSPVIVEPPIESLFTLSIYEKVKQEKTTDNYPPNDLFPINLDPIDEIDL